jgi:redox-sensitive bicupin YhaK (pirin superfamily)
MIQIRKGNERGHFDHGWLDTYHTFSFGDYRDAEHHHFRALRVINEDRVAPGVGFPMHPHRDMEIITYVLSGKLQHKDDFGNGSIVAAGEWQRMSAGSGILHSEFNPSADESVHLYQIWLFPNQKGIRPEYDQRRFDDADLQAGFRVVASPDGGDGSMRIHQDAVLSTARLAAGATTTYDLRPERYAWLQVLGGRVRVGDHELSAGDGLSTDAGERLSLTGLEPSEVLLFDLA